MVKDFRRYPDNKPPSYVSGSPELAGGGGRGRGFSRLPGRILGLLRADDRAGYYNPSVRPLVYLVCLLLWSVILYQSPAWTFGYEGDVYLDACLIALLLAGFIGGPPIAVSAVILSQAAFWFDRLTLIASDPAAWLMLSPFLPLAAAAFFTGRPFQRLAVNWLPAFLRSLILIYFFQVWLMLSQMLYLGQIGLSDPFLLESLMNVLFRQEFVYFTLFSAAAAATIATAYHVLYNLFRSLPPKRLT